MISDPESVYTEFRRGLNLAYFKIFPPSEEAVMLRNMMKDMEQTESQKVRGQRVENVLLVAVLVMMTVMLAVN